MNIVIQYSTENEKNTHINENVNAQYMILGFLFSHSRLLEHFGFWQRKQMVMILITVANNKLVQLDSLNRSFALTTSMEFGNLLDKHHV